MTHNPVTRQNMPTNLPGISRYPLFAPCLPLVTTAIILSMLNPESLALSQTVRVRLKAGDVIYADSGDAVHGGFVIKVDPKTGEQVVISSGVYLQMPFEPVIDSMGQIIVSDSGRLIQINPETGAQTIIADRNSGPLGFPYGIAIDRNGSIVAANVEAIVRVDPLTGHVETVSTGGNLFHPLAVAAASNGQLFVINSVSPRQIIQVNPQTGAQRVVSQAGLLKNPQTIAVQGNDLYVTDVATADGNFGIGRVIHVDAQSGTQRVVSEGGGLVGPVGIAMDENGQLVIGDPYTINPRSPDIASGGYDGGIIRIDPLTGTQSLLARGRGSFVNPRGVAIVPNPPRTRMN